MDIIKFSDALKKIIKTRQSDISSAITNGNAKSYDEYKALVGQYLAYTNVLQELTDLLKKQELIDDETYSARARKE